MHTVVSSSVKMLKLSWGSYVSSALLQEDDECEIGTEAGFVTAWCEIYIFDM